MSKKIPMYSIDKVEKKWAVKVSTFVRLEARAKAAGLPVATLANAILDHHVENDVVTIEMEARAEELRKKNREIRASMKAKKGIK